MIMKAYSTDFDREKCAYARIEDVNASYKDLAQVCGNIRRKESSWALEFLEKAAKGEAAVRYRRHNKRLGHRRELGGKKGRYPQKAAKIVLKLLKSAVANGMQKGLGEDYLVTHVCATKKHIYPRLAPKGRRMRSFLETSRVELVATPKELPKKAEKKPAVKPKPKEVPKKPAEKPKEVKVEEKKPEVKKPAEKKPERPREEMKKAPQKPVAKPEAKAEKPKPAEKKEEKPKEAPKPEAKKEEKPGEEVKKALKKPAEKPKEAPKEKASAEKDVPKKTEKKEAEKKTSAKKEEVKK